VPGSLEDRIDELYAAEPDAFTRARDILVKELKASGDAEGARRVAALRKPVRSAWAINRLIRDERADVERLIAVGDGLRTAQRRALSGGGAEELRERSEERRKLVRGLAERAGTYLGEREPPAGAVEDIVATLEAASIDEGAARAVLEGRLTKPLARPSGFGDVTGLRAVRGNGPTEQRSSPAEDRAEERRRERAARGAEQREAKARERVERLRGELEELQSRVASKKEELRAAEADARGAAVEARRLRR
jgi:hypothetical protein